MTFMKRVLTATALGMVNKIVVTKLLQNITETYEVHTVGQR